jgi:hypothetical protein
MKPNHFAALGLAALGSLVLAIVSYSSHVPWTEPVDYPKLFPNIGKDAAKVSTIGISQGNKSVTLELKDKTWVLKERDGYPANADKVRTLLIALQDAELAEDKTTKPERYEVLQVEDPQSKGAASNLLKLVDASNSVLAEMIVGRVRTNAFGGGKGGTYIRKPGDAQAWLVNSEIDVSADPKSWMKTRIFETQVDRIRKVTIEIPGEQPLIIDWDAASKQLKLTDIPAGKQVKFVNSIPDMIDSLANIDMEDVRKSPDTPSGSNVSTVKLESEGGLVVSYTIRNTPEGDWLSMSASGEGEHKKFAELFSAGAKGWEFKLPKTKAGELLKKRSELIDDIVVPELGPGAKAADTPPAPAAPATP